MAYHVDSNDYRSSVAELSHGRLQQWLASCAGNFARVDLGGWHYRVRSINHFDTVPACASSDYEDILFTCFGSSRNLGAYMHANTVLDRQVVHTIIEWDVRNWSRAIPFWLSALPDSLEGKRALALGERNGGLSLMLALRGANVVCSDLGGPTENARVLHSRFGVSDRVQYRSIDACAIDFQNETFDIVAFKSMLGALASLERQTIAIAEIARVLRPEGVLLFAENLRGSLVHRTIRRMVKGDSWYGWKYVTILELNDLCSTSFSSHELQTFGFASVFARWERARTLVHYFDRVVDPLIPENWKYICFGVARR